MSDYTLLLITGGACAIGFYMAWTIGANDVSNAMATAVGARAITFKQATLIAGVLIFFVAVFVGPHVTETIKGKIINNTVITDPFILILGFISSLLAAAIWSTLANLERNADFNYTFNYWRSCWIWYCCWWSFIC